MHTKKAWQYLDDILQKGEQRKRMTVQLQELCGGLADRVAGMLPQGAEIVVAGVRYKALEVRSNLDRASFIFALDQEEEGPPRKRAITNRGPMGEVFYLHGDFNCPVRVASRDEFLRFVNNLPGILGQWTQVQEQSIKALREGFEKLKAVAEGGK